MVRGPVTDRQLRSWLRCRRRAWLDRHGPHQRRQWIAHRALALGDQLRCFQLLLSRGPGHGETACAHADEGVMGLRLRGQLSTAAGPLAVEAHPSLLQRVQGPSRWGGHAYRPVLARQGHSLTREHRLLLALWGWLLAQHQRAPVPRGLALGLGEGGLVREALTLGGSLQRQMEESLKRMADELERPQLPPLANDRKKCVLCGWRNLCDAEAVAEGHLSEVSGIGGKRRELLQQLGIGGLPQLAAADPDRLAERLAAHGEQHREAAPRLVAQARVQAAGRPRRLQAGEGVSLSEPALPELLAAGGVLIYDIESDPDARDDFLHGILTLGQGSDGAWPSAAAAGVSPATAAPAPQPGAISRYHPLLALREHGEKRLWQRLTTRLERHPDWPVLHYGETESIVLLRLAERQGLSAAGRERLRGRLIDVHQRLRRHWLLPVNSYGLKAVASWQGFRWEQPGVDGARCLLWWRQWRQDRERGIRRHQQLQRIFRYNLDDCRATWAVSCWLLEQERRGGGSGHPLLG